MPASVPVICRMWPGFKPQTTEATEKQLNHYAVRQSLCAGITRPERSQFKCMELTHLSRDQLQETAVYDACQAAPRPLHHIQLRTWTFTFMHFRVGALPEVQHQFWKQLSNKVLYDYCSKKKGAFWWVFEKVTKWISTRVLKMYFWKGLSFFKEIDHGCFRVFGPYFIGKSHCYTYRLTFEFWSIIARR